MNTRFSHLDDLKDYALPLIEHQLDHWLELKEGPQKGLLEAARYSTLGSGKRFRPLLCLSIAHFYGIDLTLAIPAACSIELVHTYSLIHDDLPCMDNDDYRRGKKSLHKITTEGLALLTGDFLLTFAFEKLSYLNELSAEQRIKLIQHLSRASGHLGMVGGQYADLTSHLHPQTQEFVHWMHECKTGALMKACAAFGAILANLDPHMIEKWQNFGQKLGLLFQLVDDLLDTLATGTTGSLPIGPSSYIAFAGAKKTLAKARQLKENLIIQTKQLTPNYFVLEELIESITSQYEDLPQIAPSSI
jgi:geranylgeranyl diphosphate synthase type II